MKITKKRKIIILLSLVILVAVGAYFLFWNSEFNYAGTLEATKVDLSARVSSIVASYGVDEGDKISKDQTLVLLACEDIKLTAEISARDFERASLLFKSGSMPQETYDHLRNKRDDSALRLSWCTIKSPFQGTVLNTYREDGEWVTPGAKLLTLADLREVWAMIYVPQPMVARLSLGMKVQSILPEMGSRVFEGRITKIGDEAEFTPKNVQTREERTRLVYGIKVTFPNPEGILKPGMTLEVRLPRAK